MLIYPNIAECSNLATFKFLPDIQNVLRAITQADPFTYYPYVNRHRPQIQILTEEFFTSHVLPQLKELENYIVDFYVAPDEVSDNNIIMNFRNAFTLDLCALQCCFIDQGFAF